jgi:excisionase family DNA binding protein
MTVKPAYEVPEVRVALGNISHQKVYDLFNAGELKSFTIGRRRLVSHEALMEFIRKREQAAQASV